DAKPSPRIFVTKNRCRSYRFPQIPAQVIEVIIPCGLQHAILRNSTCGIDHEVPFVCRPNVTDSPLCPVTICHYCGPCKFISTAALPAFLKLDIYPPINFIEVLIRTSSMFPDIFVWCPAYRFSQRTYVNITFFESSFHAPATITARSFIKHEFSTSVGIFEVFFARCQVSLKIVTKNCSGRSLITGETIPVQSCPRIFAARTTVQDG